MSGLFGLVSLAGYGLFRRKKGSGPNELPEQVG